MKKQERKHAMDYRTMVNPTYLTAKSTLFMLAGMGNDDAKRVIAALGTQDILTQRDSKKQGPALPETEVKALMTGASLAIKSRYEALSRLIRTEGTKGLMDIACGYTPRGLYCDREGIDYVGLDVPVVAEELQKMAETLGISGAYVAGDATNAASLTAAAERLNRNILISCEGLLSYLSTDEFEQLLGGIRQILKSHGGAWVSSDFGVDYEAFSTACMSSPDAARLYNESRRQTMASANIYNEGVTNWDEEKKLAFLAEHGFNVEKLPFYYDDQEETLLAGLPENWKATFLRLLSAASLWKMTLSNGSAREKIEGAKEVQNLKIDYKKENGVLYCAVTGRIDTISAPALLEVFENNYDGITGIKVDAEKLEYISSAGLRVLLMAVKKAGKVTVINASDAVKEIFETTGFDQMIDVR